MENFINNIDDLTIVEKIRLVELISQLKKHTIEMNEIPRKIEKYSRELNSYKFRQTTEEYKDLIEKIKNINEELYILGVFKQEFYESLIHKYKEDQDSIKRCYEAADKIDETCKNIGCIINIFRNGNEE